MKKAGAWPRPWPGPTRTCQLGLTDLSHTATGHVHIWATARAPCCEGNTAGVLVSDDVSFSHIYPQDTDRKTLCQVSVCIHTEHCIITVLLNCSR